MKKTLLLTLVLLFPFISQAAFDIDLKYGSSGQPVKDLQSFLISQDCLSAEPTGYFYNFTLAAVKCFQLKEGITPVSGFFGPVTRARANSLGNLGAVEIATSTEQDDTAIQPQANDDVAQQLNEILKRMAEQDKINVDLQAQNEALKAKVAEPAVQQIRTSNSDNVNSIVSRFCETLNCNQTQQPKVNIPEVIPTVEIVQTPFVNGTFDISIKISHLKKGDEVGYTLSKWDTLEGQTKNVFNPDESSQECTQETDCVRVDLFKGFGVKENTGFNQSFGIGVGDGRTSGTIRALPEGNTLTAKPLEY